MSASAGRRLTQEQVDEVLRRCGLSPEEWSLAGTTYDERVIITARHDAGAVRRIVVPEDILNPDLQPKQRYSIDDDIPPAGGSGEPESPTRLFGPRLPR